MNALSRLTQRAERKARQAKQRLIETDQDEFATAERHERARARAFKAFQLATAQYEAAVSAEVVSLKKGLG